MQRLKDPRGNVIAGDFRMKLEPGERSGRWHYGTREYRKLYQGTYYFSANGDVYHPLTREQAERRGLSTFSE